LSGTHTHTHTKTLSSHVVTLLADTVFARSNPSCRHCLRT